MVLEVNILRVYFKFIKKYIKSLMMYKLDFTIGFFSMIFVHIINLIFIDIIFNNVSDINGWNFDHVVFIYSLVGVSIGLNHFFLDGLNYIPFYVLRGGLDRILLRPIEPILHIIFLKVEQNAIGGLFFSSCLLFYSIFILGFYNNFMFLCLILLIILFSVVILFSLSLFINSLSFWVLKVDVLSRVFENLYEFAKFPLSIYNRFIRGIFIFLIPLAGVIYFPVRVILFNDFSSFNLIYPPVISVVFFCISIFTWKRGVRNYGSCGN